MGLNISTLSGDDGTSFTETNSPSLQKQPLFSTSPQPTRRRYSTQLSISKQNTSALERENINILLLGAGETGKSTLFKQIKMLVEGPVKSLTPLNDMNTEYFYSEQEILDFKDAIVENVLFNVQSVIDACFDMNIPLEDHHREAALALSEDIANGKQAFEKAGSVFQMYETAK